MPAASLGYSYLKGTSFGRAEKSWVEAFFLQQTQWGGGHFWVDIGIHVPGLDALWQVPLSERSIGLIIGERLDKTESLTELLHIQQLTTVNSQPAL